jgi:transposase
VERLGVVKFFGPGVVVNVGPGRAGLSAASAGPSSRERQLEAEVADLTQALGEAHVELRVWKKSAEHRLGPSKTSR